MSGQITYDLNDNVIAKLRSIEGVGTPSYIKFTSGQYTFKPAKLLELLVAKNVDVDAEIFDISDQTYSAITFGACFSIGDWVSITRTNGWLGLLTYWPNSQSDDNLEGFINIFRGEEYFITNTNPETTSIKNLLNTTPDIDINTTDLVYIAPKLGIRTSSGVAMQFIEVSEQEFRSFVVLKTESNNE